MLAYRKCTNRSRGTFLPYSWLTTYLLVTYKMHYLIAIHPAVSLSLVSKKKAHIALDILEILNLMPAKMHELQNIHVPQHLFAAYGNRGVQEFQALWLFHNLTSGFRNFNHHMQVSLVSAGSLLLPHRVNSMQLHCQAQRRTFASQESQQLRCWRQPWLWVTCTVSHLFWSRRYFTSALVGAASSEEKACESVTHGCTHDSGGQTWFT